MWSQDAKRTKDWHVQVWKSAKWISCCTSCYSSKIWSEIGIIASQASAHSIRRSVIHTIIKFALINSWNDASLWRSTTSSRSFMEKPNGLAAIRVWKGLMPSITSWSQNTICSKTMAGWGAGLWESSNPMLKFDDAKVLILSSSKSVDQLSEKHLIFVLDQLLMPHFDDLLAHLLP